MHYNPTLKRVAFYGRKFPEYLLDVNWTHGDTIRVTDPRLLELKVARVGASLDFSGCVSMQYLSLFVETTCTEIQLPPTLKVLKMRGPDSHHAVMSWNLGDNPSIVELYLDKLALPASFPPGLRKLVLGAGTPDFQFSELPNTLEILVVLTVTDHGSDLPHNLQYFVWMEVSSRAGGELDSSLIFPPSLQVVILPNSYRHGTFQVATEIRMPMGVRLLRLPRYFPHKIISSGETDIVFGVRCWKVRELADGMKECQEVDMYLNMCESIQSHCGMDKKTVEYWNWSGF
jgi:hypothetical protein